MPPGYVAPPRMMSLVGASVSPSTWNALGKLWREWCALAREAGLPWSDKGLLELTLHLQLRDQGVSANVAQRKLAGVRFHLLIRGIKDVTQEFIVRQALIGWRKELVRLENRRPVTHALLIKLVQAAQASCSSPFKASLFTVSFSLAFFAALRVGELVSASRQCPGGLMFSDVVLSEESVQLKIRRSKTDVFGKGV